MLTAAMLAQAHETGPHVPPELLWIPLVLLAAKLSNAVEHVGQPPVLGELLMGVLLGNLGLVGVHLLEPIPRDPILLFLAEFGVVLLLFQIGLESSIARMRAVGGRAAAVAVVGMVVPFLLAVFLAPLLLPGGTLNSYLFVGAALTATSVGITARVFRDLNTLQTSEAQTVLGAAVIDDVLGLILLAVLSALAAVGTISAFAVGSIVLKALLFLVGAVVLGQLLAPRLGRALSRVQTGAGMKLSLALSSALLLAYGAGAIGLAPIVGAFAAGLVLMPVHFRDFAEAPVVVELRAVAGELSPAEGQRLLRVVDPHAERHVEELIEPLAHVFVPIFFVLTGMSVDLTIFLSLPTLLVALLLTVVAVAGKLVSGLVAGDVRRWVVGWGMVPRGEVGLIFATIGRAAGVVDEHVFAVIVMIVILTTLLTPPVLAALLKPSRQGAGAGG